MLKPVPHEATLCPTTTMTTAPTTENSLNHGSGSTRSNTTAATNAAAAPSPLSVTERLDFLQREIDQLQTRNFEKDRGKEFESSYTRVVFLMAVTYWTLFAYMKLVLKTSRPFLDALVPTLGFNISTWSLPYVKEWWIQARHYYIHGESESASLHRAKNRREILQEMNHTDDDDQEEAATTAPPSPRDVDVEVGEQE